MKKQNPNLHQPIIDNTTLPLINRLNSKAFTVEEVRKMLEKDELTGKYLNVSEVTFHSTNKRELRGLCIDKVFIDECTELPSISFMSNQILDNIFKKQTLDYNVKLKETFVSSISKIIPECNESNLFDTVMGKVCRPRIPDSFSVDSYLVGIYFDTGWSRLQTK